MLKCDGNLEPISDYRVGFLVKLGWRPKMAKKIQRYQKYYLSCPESFPLITIKTIISNWNSRATSFVSQIIFFWISFLRTIDCQVHTTCEFTFSRAKKKSKRQKLSIYSHLSPMWYLVLFLGHVKPDPGGNASIYEFAALNRRQFFQATITLGNLHPPFFDNPCAPLCLKLLKIDCDFMWSIRCSFVLRDHFAMLQAPVPFQRPSPEI